MPDDRASFASLSVRELRRRWKPTKERLAELGTHEPIRIRMHRACSWMQRVEELAEAEHDTALIFRWIALNSLYGVWDDDLGQPTPDRESLESFLDQVFEIDRDAVVPGVLQEHRKLALSIFEDAYLTRVFWENPSLERGLKPGRAKFDARTWYQQHQHRRLLDRLMDRIYFARCQLVHGGATLGGRLNRTAVRRCATMLGRLLPGILVVIIDHGSEEDWGPLCYPPQQAGRGAAGR